MRIFLIASLIVLAAPHAARAELLTATVAPGAEGARIEIFLLPTTTPINAIEGTLLLPEGAKTSKLYTGASVVQSWVEAPRESDGAIRFAGIIPGGFVGSAQAGQGLTGSSPLFSFELTGSTGPVFLTEAAAYLNDGEGTRIPVADATLKETLVAGGASQEEDRTPPEYVEATLVEEPSVAEGRPAILISAFDAQSGIDRFEVQEGDGAWTVSGEAYEVRDGSGLVPISVRAYDRAGNFIETRVEGKNAPYLKLGYALVGLVLLIIVLMAVVYFTKRRRS